MELYTSVFCQPCYEVNASLMKKCENLSEEDIKSKTHFFHGRYENVYLNENKIPQLEVIVKTATEQAAKILKVEQKDLSFSFWLNAMASGDVTTAHTHDDDDELLSCVYYIKVPDNSGDLIITEKENKVSLQPKEGTFIFFSPSTLHEVTKNESGQSRFSVAFNFGLKKS